MKNILLLTTGGTIASRQTGEGLAPSHGTTPLLGFVDWLSKDYHITLRDILQLDSSNIQPEEWQLIARSVFEAHRDFDGIVISHGTDTMAYTASMLSFMLPGIDIPVVLTGSQLPIEHPQTDGMDNLRTAFAMASSGRGGVFIAFNRKVMLGCRAVKTHTMDFDAFASVNHPLVGRISGRGLTIFDDAIPSPAGPCRLEDSISSQVFLIKLTPGLDPGVFDMLINMNYRGLVIEAFGAGGLHFVRRNLVEKLNRAAEAGISVVVCSQCLYESSDFNLYQTGRAALQQGAIESLDMTTEAAVTKLMWALGQTDSPAGVREIFSRNLAGEIGL